MRQLDSHVAERHSLAVTVMGVIYGGLLAWCAFAAALVGEGTYIPITVFSAPFLFLGTTIAFVTTLVSIPILWGIVGFLVTRLRRVGARVALVLLLALHYAGMIPLLVWSSIDEPARIRMMLGRDPFLVIFGLGTYLMGQVLVWFVLGASIRRSQIGR